VLSRPRGKPSACNIALAARFLAAFQTRRHPFEPTADSGTPAMTYTFLHLTPGALTFHYQCFAPPASCPCASRRLIRRVYSLFMRPRLWGEVSQAAKGGRDALAGDSSWRRDDPLWEHVLKFRATSLTGAISSANVGNDSDFAQRKSPNPPFVARQRMLAHGGGRTVLIHCRYQHAAVDFRLAWNGSSPGHRAHGDQRLSCRWHFISARFCARTQARVWFSPAGSGSFPGRQSNSGISI